MRNSKRLEEFSDSDLAKELERRKSRSELPKPLANPDFSKLQKLIIDEVNQQSQVGFKDEDSEHYVFEEAINAVYGKAYWDWRNKQKF